MSLFFSHVPENFNIIASFSYASPTATSSHIIYFIRTVARARCCPIRIPHDRVFCVVIAVHIVPNAISHKTRLRWRADWRIPNLLTNLDINGRPLRRTINLAQLNCQRAHLAFAVPVVLMIACHIHRTDEPPPSLLQMKTSSSHQQQQHITERYKCANVLILRSLFFLGFFGFFF